MRTLIESTICLLLAASMPMVVSSQKEDEEIECSSTPFCGLLKDCCSAHAECFSMCCSKTGACLEPQFCYGDKSTKNAKQLIEPVATVLLKPSVNSTSSPYFYPDDVEDCQIPCFTYAYKDKDLGTLNKDGTLWTIGLDDEYEEPLVWKIKGSSKTLVDYKFAYGNRISDAEDNPMSISTSGTLSQNTGESGGGSGGASSEAAYSSDSMKSMPAPSSAKMASSDMMPGYGYYGGYGNYYGGYGGYSGYSGSQYDSVTYKSHADSQGSYSYYQRGDYKQYSSYFYVGIYNKKTYDGKSGQLCNYHSQYKTWAAYGKNEEKCSHEVNFYKSSEQNYYIMAAATLIIGSLFACILGSSASCISERHRDKIKQSEESAINQINRRN